MIFCRVRVLALLSLAVMSSLTACSAQPAGGQSEDDALAQVRSIDGIEDAIVAEGGSYSGFNRESYVVVTVTLAPGFKVGKMTDFVEFLIDIGWSVNIEEPNTDIAFRIDGSANSALEAALITKGWDIRTGQGGGHVHVPHQVVRAKLGRWPGPVPDTPVNMIVPENQSPNETDSSALDLAPRAALTVE